MNLAQLKTQIRFSLAKTTLRKPLQWWRHQGLREADVFVASYPRSGNTWLRFMLTDYLTGQDPYFPLVNREIPGVGEQHLASDLLPGNGRLIKTHEAYRSEYQRGIYLVRDVRDVVCSEYAYHVWSYIDQGKSFADFFDAFLAGEVTGYGSWQEHVRSWADGAEEPNRDILIIKFEQMRADTAGILAQMLTYLGVEPDLERVRQVIENNSVTNMKRKEAKAKETVFKERRQDMEFVRKGKVGNWKEQLTAEQQERLLTHTETLLRRFEYLG